MADYNDWYNEYFGIAGVGDDDEFLSVVAWSDVLDDSDETYTDTWVWSATFDESGEPWVDTLGWSDTLDDGLSDDFVDTIEWSDADIVYSITDEYTDTWRTGAAFTDRLADEFAESFAWTGALDDGAAAVDLFADTWGWSDQVAEILAFIEDYADARTWVDELDDLVGADYGAWVMNQAGAFVQYDNFAFDSFATLPDGTTLAAGAGGLFALEGADDNGTPIAAEIKHGLSDFNTPDQKRMVRLSLSLAAPVNALVIKQRMEADGVVEEHWVQPAGGVATTAPKTKVYRLFQGIKGRYCAAVIANKAGADFDIAETHLYLSRVDSQR